MALALGISALLAVLHLSDLGEQIGDRGEVFRSAVTLAWARGEYGDFPEATDIQLFVSAPALTAVLSALGGLFAAARKAAPARLLAVLAAVAALAGLAVFVVRLDGDLGDLGMWIPHAALAVGAAALALRSMRRAT